jgi:hypothetical protein
VRGGHAGGGARGGGRAGLPSRAQPRCFRGVLRASESVGESAAMLSLSGSSAHSNTPEHVALTDALLPASGAAMAALLRSRSRRHVSLGWLERLTRYILEAVQPRYNALSKRRGARYGQITCATSLAAATTADSNNGL